MTVVLATRASSLRSRLEALDQAASNVAEVSALEGLRSGLAGRAENLSLELAKEKLLAGAECGDCASHPCGRPKKGGWTPRKVSS